MSVLHTAPDLDDAEALQHADREGWLRAVAGAGASVRATDAAVAEGALAGIADTARARSIVVVTGRGTAAAAAAVVVAVLGPRVGAPIVVATTAPGWLGPLDVLVVVGDDAGDPALVDATSLAVRRGARVVVTAPFEGPLREAAAGRAASLAPRLWLPDAFGLHRHLAALLATVAAVDAGARGVVGGAVDLAAVDLAGMADALDAEAVRDAPGADAFTNPAKALAHRLLDGRVIFTADTPAPLVIARHGAATALRVAGRPTAAADLPDVLAGYAAGLRAGGGAGTDDLFHDDELDGPRAEPVRVVALAEERAAPLLAARLDGFGGAEVLTARDGATDPRGDDPADVGTQCAVLALRCEFAAVYARLARG